VYSLDIDKSIMFALYCIPRLCLSNFYWWSEFWPVVWCWGPRGLSLPYLHSHTSWRVSTFGHRFPLTCLANTALTVSSVCLSNLCHTHYKVAWLSVHFSIGSSAGYR